MRSACRMSRDQAFVAARIRRKIRTLLRSECRSHFQQAGIRTCSPAPASRFEGPPSSAVQLRKTEQPNYECSVLLMTQSKYEFQCELYHARVYAGGGDLAPGTCGARADRCSVNQIDSAEQDAVPRIVELGMIEEIENSARNCIEVDSVILVVFKSEVSKLNCRGPQSGPRRSCRIPSRCRLNR
jgi:hypothetical protein